MRHRLLAGISLAALSCLGPLHLRRLLPLEASPNLRVTAERWTFHHHIPGELQVPYEPPRDDVSHEAVRVMPTLAAFKLEREGERRREVIRIGGCEFFGEVGHPMTIAEAENKARTMSDASSIPCGEEGTHTVL